MSKKPKVLVDPVDLTYIDDSKLCSATEEEEFLDLYEVGMLPCEFADAEARARYEAFLKKNGYEL